MANKNLFKKIVSVAMAGALTLSMAFPVGAATNSVMSASVVPVESGDKVVSAFGTEDEANDYFAAVLEQYQNGII